MDTVSLSERVGLLLYSLWDSERIFIGVRTLLWYAERADRDLNTTQITISNNLLLLVIILGHILHFFIFLSYGETPAFETEGFLNEPSKTHYSLLASFIISSFPCIKFMKILKKNLKMQFPCFGKGMDFKLFSQSF